MIKACRAQTGQTFAEAAASILSVNFDDMNELFVHTSVMYSRHISIFHRINRAIAIGYRHSDEDDGICRHSLLAVLPCFISGQKKARW
ncbi:MAG: hypothetical protein ACI83P_001201 [Janthinobacterium sp.]|jgi:hypothetical protein